MTKQLLSARVLMDDNSIAKLLSFYRLSTGKIIQEMTTATDFGVAKRKQILKQIDSILLDLDKETQEWFQQEVENYYLQGTTDAKKALKSEGFDIETVFSKIDREAVKSLTDEGLNYYREAFSGVRRSAMRMLSEATRERLKAIIAEGRITGDTRKAISARIKDKLQEDMSAIIDRAGRRWSLDRYAEMVTRTLLVKTTNDGMQNKLRSNGYDLVQVSDHAGECELCSPWEGRILSMSGKHPKYPTTDDAELAGLFHPNCRHRYLPYHEPLLSVSHAWNYKTQSYIQL